ncbi:putative cyclin-D6-1 [Impatiens glandulifera]|uniref:putative cyclin-D6-1 n=1 Tax=Impatiens glandulifera TaxID=253017 RepID=UPI001FB14BA8|nr:putative cyclin-D6-1 [Impatiens glandulifera]
MMMEDFDLENPLGLHLINHHHHHQISSLFDIESDHMPPHDYLQNLQISEADNNVHDSVRHEAVSLIMTHFSFRFTPPYLSYLAITYLDRFLSAQGIPERKPWLSRILAISCVSLALKMMGGTSSSDLSSSSSSSSVDMQNDDEGGGGGGGGGEIIFERKSIHRMELLILGVLKWRMRSVTPFSFINFFVSLFKFRDPPLTQALKARANHIILKLQADVSLLEYKPSIMAASSLLSACHTLFPLQFACFKKAISNCSNVDQDELVRCHDLVEEIVMEEYECIMDNRVCRSSITAVNVLDRKWSSSSSGDTTTLLGVGGGDEIISITTTPAPATETLRESKRRKTDCRRR